MADLPRIYAKTARAQRRAQRMRMRIRDED